MRKGKMSCVKVPATAEVEACGNCGKEGKEDGVKLKNCTACFLVKYCSLDCQKTHRKQHKKACKERAAQLKDEKLYSQGHERAEAEFCPLCLLAIPLPMEIHALLRPCCTKLVCFGCCLAAAKRGMGESCPFCRAPGSEIDVERLRRVRKRVAAKDPESICHLGDLYHAGSHELEKDESRALELWSEAAELGSTKALSLIGMAYYNGRLGINQDIARGIRYWESGAMQGGASSRHSLGLVERNNNEFDRAMRHFMISAKMGYKDSLDAIKDMFAKGLATKAQYVEGLKGYQEAIEDMMSPDRDEYKARYGTHGDETIIDY